jgi:hypothetical protein
MSVGNIKIMEEILEELRMLDSKVTDMYVKCAVQAYITKYQNEINQLHKQNALSIVEHKIAHLVRKLK